MGFWSNLGKAVWNFDSVKNGFQTCSTIASCIPVFGNAAAVVLEGGGIIAGLIEGKESPTQVWTQGLTGMAAAAIPFGKVCKAGASVARASIKAVEKEAVELALKEGTLATSTAFIQQGSKAVLADSVKEGLEASGKAFGKTVDGAGKFSRGMSQMPAGSLFGGASRQTVAAARNTAANEMSEILAKNGIDMSAGQISKIMLGKTIKADFCSSLRRLPAYVGTNFSVSFGESITKEYNRDYLMPHEFLEGTRKHFPEFDSLSLSEKELVLRKNYDTVREITNKEIKDNESSQSMSVDEVILKNLGEIPSNREKKTTAEEIEAAWLSLNKKDPAQLTAVDIKKIDERIKEIEAMGYYVAPRKQEVQEPQENSQHVSPPPKGINPEYKLEAQPVR